MVRRQIGPPRHSPAAAVLERRQHCEPRCYETYCEPDCRETYCEPRCYESYCEPECCEPFCYDQFPCHDDYCHDHSCKSDHCHDHYGKSSHNSFYARSGSNGHSSPSHVASYGNHEGGGRGRK